MGNRWADNRLFLKEFLRNFHSTGAVLPSGPSLAAALAKHVRGAQPKRILEVGPGTGAVTGQIVRRLGPLDQFDMVELNDDFVSHLRRRFVQEPHFAEAAERCQVIHGRLEELPEGSRYDVIISCLPLNNFPVSLVEQILEMFPRMLNPGGTLSFFEYMAVRPIKSAIASGAEKQRIQGISQIIGGLLDRHAVACDWIWPNVPPAWVHHLRFDVPDAGETSSADSEPAPAAADPHGIDAAAPATAEPSADYGNGSSNLA